MRLFAHILAGLIAASLATPAAAQIAPSRSGISTSTVTNSQEIYIENLWRYGRCFAEVRPKDIDALLATKSGSAEENAIYSRMRGATIPCDGGDMYFTAPVRMLRGAVAEGAYRQMSKQKVMPALTLEQPSALTASLSDASRCYVAGHAEQAHALIVSTIAASKKEEQAINAMLKDFFRCLPPHTPVDMPSIDFRYGIAEALYHAALPQARGVK